MAVSTSMRTELVLDALEQAIWSRAERLAGLICHSDDSLSLSSMSAFATPNGWPRSVQPLDRVGR